MSMKLLGLALPFALLAASPASAADLATSPLQQITGELIESGIMTNTQTGTLAGRMLGYIGTIETSRRTFIDA